MIESSWNSKIDIFIVSNNFSVLSSKYYGKQIFCVVIFVYFSFKIINVRMKYKLANDIKAIIVNINNYNCRNLFPNLKVKTSH